MVPNTVTAPITIASAPSIRSIDPELIYQAAAYFFSGNLNNIIGSCGISNSSYSDLVVMISPEFMERSPDPKLCKQCIKIWHEERSVVVRINGRSDLVAKLDIQVTREVMRVLGAGERTVLPVMWQAFPCE